VGLPRKVEIKNKKATFEFFFIDTYEAGLKLVGTEVKALREGNANLSDAYCIFNGNNLEVHSMYIGEYKFGNVNNHETRRVRRLLLKKSELKKLKRKVDEKGNTIVPFKLYFNDRGFAKLEIALAKGKKSFDKRDQIKERDNKRELDRMKKITI
jgi:SsrA-binding protein